jgi:hypothetical protein
VGEVEVTKPAGRSAPLSIEDIVTCLPVSLKEILGRCNYVRQESVPMILGSLALETRAGLEALNLIQEYESAAPPVTPTGWEVIEHVAKRLDSPWPSEATRTSSGGKTILEMVLEARQTTAADNRLD